MLRTFLRDFSIVVLLIVCFHRLEAQQTLFGPETFRVGDQRQHRQFDAGTPSACMLQESVVLEAESDGVASASVSVNGGELIREADFSNAPRAFGVPLTVRGENDLIVDVTGGQRSATLTLAVRRYVEERVWEASMDHRGVAEARIAADATAEYALYLAQPNESRRARVAVFVNGVKAHEVLPAYKAPSMRLPLSLSENSVVRVESHGAGLSMAIAKTRQCLQVFIDTPNESASVEAGSVVVTGRLIGPKNSGVTVNGVVAGRDLSHAGTAADPIRWVAILRPPVGPATVRAVATSITGSTASAERSINVTPATSTTSILLVPSDSAVVVDEEVRFRVKGLLATDTVSVDYDGDGVNDVTASDQSEFATRYLERGVFTSRVTVARAGQELSAFTIVTVHDFESIDGLIQESWQVFVSALRDRNAAVARACIATRSREKYGRVFGLLPPKPTVATITEIYPQYITSRIAAYAAFLNQNGERHGYQMFWSREVDGTWRLASL